MVDPGGGGGAWECFNEDSVTVDGDSCPATQHLQLVIRHRVLGKRVELILSVLSTNKQNQQQRDTETLGGDGHVCYLECDDGNTHVHTCQNHQTAYINYVQSFVNQL